MHKLVYKMCIIHWRWETSLFKSTTIFKNKIIKNNNIAVTADEAKDEAKNYIRSQFARYGQTPEETEVEKIANQILSKQEEAQKIFESLYSKKVLDLLKNNCKLETKEVSYNEFFGLSN